MSKSEINGTPKSYSFALIGRVVVHVIEQDGLVQGVLVLIPEADSMLLDNVAVSTDRLERARFLAPREVAARPSGRW